MPHFELTYYLTLCCRYPQYLPSCFIFPQGWSLQAPALLPCQNLQNLPWGFTLFSFLVVLHTSLGLLLCSLTSSCPYNRWLRCSCGRSGESLCRVSETCWAMVGSWGKRFHNFPSEDKSEGWQHFQSLLGWKEHLHILRQQSRELHPCYFSRLKSCSI